MFFPRMKFLSLLTLALLTLSPAMARAEAVPSATALTYAKLLGQSCPGQWESQTCLKAASQSSLTLAANYGGALQERKLNAEAEDIKQHCAASTAATQGEYPAYALKSAFIECANTMSDVAAKTSIDPDVSHYQLLVATVMCLDKDAGCVEIEKTLKGHAAK
jgi:hypothetical protein